MGARERILQFVEYKKISKSKFYKETGLSNGFLDKNNSPGTDKIEQIIYIYPELNLEWLITGKGEMLRQVSAGKPPTLPVAAPAAMPEHTPTVAEAAFYKEFLEKKNIEIRELNREIGALQHANAAFQQQVVALQEQSRELVAVQHENTALKQQVADLLQERENKKNSATRHDAVQLAVPEHQLPSQPYPEYPEYPEILIAAEPMRSYKRNQRAP